MMHDATARLLPYFEVDHLPADLAAVSRPFGELARAIAADVGGPEATVCIRKLLEAKDCAVRAALEVRKLLEAQP